jgi:hypothetical protein
MNLIARAEYLVVGKTPTKRTPDADPHRAGGGVG